MGTRSFFGMLMKQRDSIDCFRCFVFVCSASDIGKWSGIRRVGQADNGTQRVRKPSRVKAIRRFLEASPNNVIPSSILLGFSPGIAQFSPLENVASSGMQSPDTERLSYGFLSFSFSEDGPEHERPALVVDGQHRLGGMESLGNENVLLTVVAMLDVDVQEQAFQFIVLNNKAVRVPTDNVKAILAGFNEDELSERLLKAGVSYGEVSPVLREVNDLEQSPFKDCLDWPYNRRGSKIVSLTAIEQCLRYIRNEFGPLFSDDDDSVVELLCAVWTPVKERWPDLWCDDEESKLMKKVSICSLNEVMVHRIKFAREFSMVDVYDSESVGSLCRTVLKSVNDLFWKTAWRVRVQDNANVRNMIVKDLNTMIANSRDQLPWSEGLKLISFDSIPEGE